MSRAWKSSPMLLGSLLLLPLLPATGEAQLCFRGHPPPRCSGFTILEFTGGARLSQPAASAYPGGSNAYMAWSAGYLRNLGVRSALGAAFKLSANDDGTRYGPVLRYRRWLGPTWSLDFAPGVLLGGNENYVSLRFPSATADLGINWGDRVSLILGLDQVRYEGGTGRWEAHVGLRLGSWLAPLATLGLGVLAGATYNH